MLLPTLPNCYHYTAVAQQMTISTTPTPALFFFDDDDHFAPVQMTGC